jgi:hypothetical protein
VTCNYGRIHAFKYHYLAGLAHFAKVLYKFRAMGLINTSSTFNRHLPWGFMKARDGLRQPATIKEGAA